MPASHLEDPMFYTTTYASPLGELTLAAHHENLVGIWFEGQAHFGATLGADVQPRANLPVFDATRYWLDVYFWDNGATCAQASLEQPALELIGTPFQTAVWQELLAISYGQTATYAEIAYTVGSALSRQTSPRAVAQAVARNPISFIVPCHRVIGANGSLRGYAGGTERKQWLLEHEAATRPAPAP